MVHDRRRTRRRFLGALAALGAAAGPSLRKAAAADSFTLRINIPNAPNGVHDLTARHIAAAVERRSNGQLKIEVYPNGTLVSQAGAVSAVQTGVVDLAMAENVLFTPVVPQFAVLSLPFLYSDFAGGYRFLDGPVGQDLLAQLDAKGIIGLAWGTQDFRNVETTTKAVVTPDDMKGLRIRTGGGPVFIAMYEALGAIPVVIDFTEVYTALSQHTVDGLDIGLATVALGKYSVVVKHAAMTNHTLNLSVLAGSKRKIEAMPVALQQILKEECKAAAPYQRSIALQQTNDAIQTLKKEGMAFTDIQYPAFRKAMDPVYAQLRSKLGAEFMDRVARATSAPR
jgi:TRAP-type transport system periplasmic protein